LAGYLFAGFLRQRVNGLSGTTGKPIKIREVRFYDSCR
jgi:hypothetical protein